MGRQAMRDAAAGALAVASDEADSTAAVGGGGSPVLADAAAGAAAGACAGAEARAERGAPADVPSMPPPLATRALAACESREADPPVPSALGDGASASEPPALRAASAKLLRVDARMSFTFSSSSASFHCRVGSGGACDAGEAPRAPSSEESGIEGHRIKLDQLMGVISAGDEH